MSHTNVLNYLSGYPVVKEPGLDSHIREIRFLFELSSWHVQYPLRGKRNRGAEGGGGGGGREKVGEETFLSSLFLAPPPYPRLRLQRRLAEYYICITLYFYHE